MFLNNVLLGKKNRFLFRIYRHSLIFLLVWIFFLTEPLPGFNQEEVGVGMVTYSYDDPRADSLERKLNIVLGQSHQVKYVFNPRTVDEFFDILTKIKKRGQKVNLLVLASHGSAQTPSIKLANGYLNRVDVNIFDIQKKIDLYEKKLRHTGALNRREQQSLNKWKRRKRQITQLSGVMSSGARVVLINCSTAATREGEEFVRSLGAVLLGNSGGTIVASRKDVVLEYIESWWQSFMARIYHGTWAQYGDYTVSGDWMYIKVPRSYSSSNSLSFDDYMDSLQTYKDAFEDVLGPWEFGRNPNNRIGTVILSKKQSLVGDYFISGYSHPNETYWKLVDKNTLIFKHKDGYITTRFSRKGANRWEGNFIPPPGWSKSGKTTVHYLRRIR
jgi:hypothetical protein